MKQTPTMKSFLDEDDLTQLQSIELLIAQVKFCTSLSSSAHQIKGKTTENAGSLVHGFNTMSLSKRLEKVSGEGDGENEGWKVKLIIY